MRLLNAHQNFILHSNCPSQQGEPIYAMLEYHDDGEQSDDSQVTTFPTHASEGAFHNISGSNSGPRDNNRSPVHKQIKRNAVINMALDSPNPIALAMSAVAQKPPQTTYSEVPFSYKNPNKSYAPILALGEERNLILVTSKDETSGKIFAIKRLLSFSQARNPQIRQVPHENVVTIREMMLHENFIFIVYEKMRICLADIIALPIEIDEHHVATICTEVRLAQSAESIQTHVNIGIKRPATHA